MAVPPSKVVDTSSWLKREQVEARCSCSTNTVSNWIKSKLLNPRRALRETSNGAMREMQVFDPVEVERRAAARARGAATTTRLPDGPGEVAARAFEFFEGGTSLRDVVMRLREPPQRIAELHEQWMAFGGCEMVVSSTAREELEALLGRFDGIAGLVERVRQRLGATSAASQPAP